MTIGQLQAFNQDGRARGHFVYMLLCQDSGGPIYIKIGITGNPIQRFRSLRCGCPVTPGSFAYFEVPNENVARRIESALHEAFHGWNAHLEWFVFLEAERPAFNEVLQSVLAEHRIPGRKFEWNKISVKELIRIGDRNRRYAQRLFAKRGLHYQDYLRDQRTC